MDTYDSAALHAAIPLDEWTLTMPRLGLAKAELQCKDDIASAAL